MCVKLLIGLCYNKPGVEQYMPGGLMNSYYRSLRYLHIFILVLLCLVLAGWLNAAVKSTALEQDIFIIDTAAGFFEGTQSEAVIRPLLSRIGAPTVPQDLIIDYPLKATVYPPDLVPPTVLFHDRSESSDQWLIDVRFAAAPFHIYVLTDGRTPEKTIDPRCVRDYNQYQESDYQAAAKAWMPSEKTWSYIRGFSESDIEIRIFGMVSAEDPQDSRILSQGNVNIRISRDPVGAPIFYRDVPLMPSRNNEGVIQPLSEDAVPLIQWRMRDLARSEAPTVMAALPTCGNCHSFSFDGSTLGMDMDGPKGDKGAYAVVPVSKQIVIEQENVFSWNKYNADKVTFGLFSRVSPDGQFIVSAVDESVFVTNYMDYKFLQTFYPTAGILAVYSRRTGKISPLPGADDPEYIHGNAVWSPDGKTIVFIRARAQDPFPPGAPIAERANDPNECQIQYDLYSIPFNGGRGGTAQPIPGASNNGMSNAFPKFSPDGKWIVFVQAGTGLLMRPDSELYIIPAAGGTARKMNCNTSLMNSWHSWSPNSRRLVFSSKSNTPYTQMFLTHIDEAGTDTPAVLIPNSTADNRAVNIPEFVNIAPDGIENIQVPAVDYRRHLDRGEKLIREKNWDKALAELEKARELKADYAITYEAIGYSLTEQGEVKKAIEYFNKAIELDPFNVLAHCYLGIALIRDGNIKEARNHFQFAVDVNPMNYQIYYNLGSVEVMEGNYILALDHYKKAIELYPEYADAHYNLGLTYNRLGDFLKGIDHLKTYVGLNPQDPEAHSALAFALNRTGDILPAVEHYQAAYKLAPEDLNVLNNLAWILATSSRLELRDGAQAVELAETLCRLTDYRTPEALDTLAAAYAENGQFDKAVETISRSISMTTGADPKLDFRRYLSELFKNGERYLRK